MEHYYTSERNVQILISLLKAHGIKKIVASPGTTNVCFVASIQQDSYFEIYSSADERSAAYIACGLAAESGDPVVISCTGATASRNYYPGLTEAYYRKLPVLAVTSSQSAGRIGHHMPQVTNRLEPPSDIAKLSVHLPEVHGQEEEWECVAKINMAISELKRNGGGPVHINLTTAYSNDFSVKELPRVRAIFRVGYEDNMPEIGAENVAIYVGTHTPWSGRLTKAVDAFCECYNGAVICDQTSNYRGKYRVDACLVANQVMYHSPCCSPELMIHIGEITGAFMRITPKDVWRVSPDGEMRDTFKALRYVFEMDEATFFERFAQIGKKTDNTSYYEMWKNERTRLEGKIPELPFSNAWAAQQTLPRLPKNSVLHLGILNSLRAWNYCKARNDVLAFCNTGGFGIDGCVSSLVGASLAHRDKLYFGVVGDLAFFYDMNSIGNRHVGNNIRLLVVNNGKGFEFKYFNNFATKVKLGDSIEEYIAAGGHYGNKSAELLKHYAEDLGFKYLAASTKEEYQSCLDEFVSPEIEDKPILFEIFTDSQEENQANYMMETLEKDTFSETKKLAKNILGDKGVQVVKNILKR